MYVYSDRATLSPLKRYNYPCTNIRLMVQLKCVCESYLKGAIVEQHHKGPIGLEPLKQIEAGLTDICDL